MMTTYSPHREELETPHLPTPNSIPHFDPHSAIREIRRSLSRSPSKTAELRQYPFRSPVAASVSFSPSPLSPSGKPISDHHLQVSAAMSPHVSRAPPVSRLQRPLLRRTTQTNGITRTRTSPKSPSKRALSDSCDGGNSAPMPLRKRNSTEAERDLTLKSLTGNDGKENDKAPDDVLAWKSVQSRHEKRRSGGALMSAIAPLSPMKRSDAPRMDAGPDLESPSAKRRSIHGPSLDFSIFESDNLDGSLFNDRRSQDDNDCFGNLPLPATRFSTIPKRSSSLRKSTLQQRQFDRPSSLKISQASLETHFQSLPRESPFSPQTTHLNVSGPAIATNQPALPQQARHPLSRTMTQSSSQPSEQDESPTHEPIHRPNRPRSHDFSKSLPIGSARPMVSPGGNEHSSQGSFATPGNYKAAKPLPAAFMSTGLISKKNRNVDDPDAGLPKAHMPDTPCKRQSVVFPNDDKFAPANALANRAARQSFGTPATPLDVHHGSLKVSVFPFAKSVGLFGARSSKHNLVREGSFGAGEGDDNKSGRSPLVRADSQSTDSDYPPTPTKHIIEASARDSVSPSPHHASQPKGSKAAGGDSVMSSKLSPILGSPGVDGDSDSVMEDSPSSNLRPKSTAKFLSDGDVAVAQDRWSRYLSLPTPLSRKNLSIPALHSPALERAKKSSVSPVSPRIDRTDRVSPHTPLEGYFPPDPSGLTISGLAARRGSAHGAIIPATPTGPRDLFPNFSNRPSLNSASVEESAAESSLLSRFEKVDLVGSGEFSHVFRVSQPPQDSPYHKIYSVSTSRPSSRSSLPGKLWAVKKSRYAYTGPKDRQRKIHEVDVLKALGHSDHIVTFVDSWEEEGHLYIQTEFCEEGTLALFLADVGRKARLDDFRIWKILLELSMGLRHIHNCGYIHLDLKPANVLITFEGVLKIADFGMATKWPAKAGIDGEGDREYIGPEVLMGKYDKPADIFALGLIMLETAGNVELPDNGVSWQKLRNGDMSDVPSLTWSSGTSGILRDSSGNPLSRETSCEPEEFTTHSGLDGIDDEVAEYVSTKPFDKALDSPRSGELVVPPKFMIDPSDDQALEKVVRWMISPDPQDRPLASQVLATEGVRWAEARRRAGATVFEGNWGPADEILAEDAEMIDV